MSLKYVNTQIVFQEFPNETTLAINFSNCPYKCEGCHSSYLWDDVGTELTVEAFENLINKYIPHLTCVGFMGGDREMEKILELSDIAHRKGIKTGWYTGRSSVTDELISHFDYVKYGPYIEERGGLNSKDTNQIFLKRTESGDYEDITSTFFRK